MNHCELLKCPCNPLSYHFQILLLQSKVISGFRYFQFALKDIDQVYYMRARLCWGKPPKPPLSVLDVGYAHVRREPLKPPQIVWLFRGFTTCGRDYAVGDPRAPPRCVLYLLTVLNNY
jgi:hypothetical protein